MATIDAHWDREKLAIIAWLNRHMMTVDIYRHNETTFDITTGTIDETNEIPEETLISSIKMYLYQPKRTKGELGNLFQELSDTSFTSKPFAIVPTDSDIKENDSFTYRGTTYEVKSLVSYYDQYMILDIKNIYGQSNWNDDSEILS